MSWDYVLRGQPLLGKRALAEVVVGRRPRALGKGLVRLVVVALVLAACSHEKGSPQQFTLEDVNHDGKIVILAFGDSITRGVGDGPRPGDTPPGSAGYPLRLQTLLGVTVINDGHSGERTTEGLLRLQRDVKDTHPDYAILVEGTNDLRGWMLIVGAGGALVAGGFVPVGGDLQSSGIVHHMLLDVVVDPAQRPDRRGGRPAAVGGLRGVGGNRGRELPRPDRRRSRPRRRHGVARLARAGRRRARRPQGCFHIFTLAHLLGGTTAWALGRERERFGRRDAAAGRPAHLSPRPARRRRPGARRRAPSGAPAHRPAVRAGRRRGAVDATPRRELLEVRLRSRSAARGRYARPRGRRSPRGTPRPAEHHWRPRRATWRAPLAGLSLAARPERGAAGAASATTRRRSAGARRRAHARARADPGVRRRRRPGRARAARGHWLLGMGGRPDSCWMWRRDGALQRPRSPDDPTAF